MESDKYGVFYTPSRLSLFLAELLNQEAIKDHRELSSILDPACGQGSLLIASKQVFGDEAIYHGIDVDADILASPLTEFNIKICDAIYPTQGVTPWLYWSKELGDVDAIVANPPWSSEKIYDRSKLVEIGYLFTEGQYDSFVLFIDLAYNLVSDGGYFAFIIPDSLCNTPQNKSLRKFLINKTEIRVIARLGEKLFEGVNRSTTLIVCRKSKPSSTTQTSCFRLSKVQRDKYMREEAPLMSLYHESVHVVDQSRFLKHKSLNFDIDARREDEALLDKIEENCLDLDNVLEFSRGVEISKSGRLFVCPVCDKAQGYTAKQKEKRTRKCKHCKRNVPMENEKLIEVVSEQAKPNHLAIYAGEDIQRYRLGKKRFIQRGIAGVQYKRLSIYTGEKIFFRKTGLGINAMLDTADTASLASVYLLKPKPDAKNAPCLYFLALFNSRVVYYYYLKKYGENEWKSHPHFTKKIIFDLPIKKYQDSPLDRKIISKCKSIVRKYTKAKDIELESLVKEKYGLNDDEFKLIIKEINQMDELGAIEHYKMEVV
jgi:hypothetical protein